jgi:hypothetical protein
MELVFHSFTFNMIAHVQYKLLLVIDNRIRLHFKTIYDNINIHCCLETIFSLTYISPNVSYSIVVKQVSFQEDIHHLLNCYTHMCLVLKDLLTICSFQG